LATANYSGNAGGTVEIYDVASGALRTSISYGEPGRPRSMIPNCIAWSADGRTLAVSTDDPRIELWDTATGSLRATLQRRESNMPVWVVAFSPNGATLVAAEAGGTLAFWDARTLRERDKVHTHPVNPEGLAFTPDSQTLATAGSDRTIKIWDVGSMRERATLQGHEGTVNSLAFSPDGKTLASGSDDKTIRLWDTYTWQELVGLEIHKVGVRHLTFSCDGQLLVSHAESPDKEHEVAIWSAPHVITPVSGL
jgi:WD40 repeat protein